MRVYIARILQKQSSRLISKLDAKIVVVAGSVGKTSTTDAIATVLSVSLVVRKTIGNYNTDIGVPCSIFGSKIPDNTKNPLAWAFIMALNELKILRPKAVDVFVLELGTDHPGELAWFEWMKPHIAVVTAVAPEHMENFSGLDAVAKEELSVAGYSVRTILNKRMVASKYQKSLKEDFDLYDRSDLKKYKLTASDLKVTGKHSQDAIAAALSVGKLLDMSREKLIRGAKSVVSQPGRMRVLDGIKESTLIDDTYNSSPEAAKAAIDYLCDSKAPQRIALLGNMNELGESSRQEHLDIGEYCDPDKIDLIVTLGPDANQFTAPAARAHGCNVKEAKTPYEAARIIKKAMKPGALVLLKGSQNKVFAEEATKLLLKNKDDEKHLVRQSAHWLIKKNQNFNEN